NEDFLRNGCGLKLPANIPPQHDRLIDCRALFIGEAVAHEWTSSLHPLINFKVAPIIGVINRSKPRQACDNQRGVRMNPSTTTGMRPNAPRIEPAIAAISGPPSFARKSRAFPGSGAGQCKPGFTAAYSAGDQGDHFEKIFLSSRTA